MTSDTQRLFYAYRASGLALLGFTFERALSVPMIRIALECKARSQHKSTGNPAPIQPELI